MERKKLVGEEKLMVFTHKFGPCTLMGLNHKKDQEWGVSLLIQKGNEISCATD